MRQASQCTGHTGQHVHGAIRIAILLACATVFVCAGSVAADARTARASSEAVQAHDQPQLARGQGADELSSQRRRPRSRTVIEVRRQFLFDEPGAIYGYPPGNYILGPYGILYGPYPIRRSPSVVFFE
jgi:hypothetical protein